MEGYTHTSIHVEKQDADTYAVSVSQKHGNGTVTHHTVYADDAYIEKLGWDAARGEALVRASFVFLLERESNESILRTFSLSDISRYFPEYETELSKGD